MNILIIVKIDETKNTSFFFYCLCITDGYDGHE